MKRFILTAGAAALAGTVALVMLTTCMFFEEQPAQPEYDEQGRQVKTITILTGDDPSSRNMALKIAEVSVNYYEVVFTNGAGEYFRAAGPRGKQLTVRIPISTVVSNLASSAIAFAGYWDRENDDKTLLATGTATHLNYGVTGGTDPQAATGATTAIAGTTENIRFLLVAIETEYRDAATANFQVLSTEYDGATTGSSYVTASASLNNPLNTQLIYDSNNDSREHPFWKLPKTTGEASNGNVKLATAKVTYRPGVYAGGNPGGGEPPITDHRVGVIADFDEPNFDSWAILTGNARDGVTAVKVAVDGLSGQIPLPATSIPLALEMMDEPVNEGFCMLLLNIPVKALTWNGYDRGDLWMLRNGLYDHEIHDNTTSASLGGALLLCIGEPVSAQGAAIRILLHGPISQMP